MVYSVTWSSPFKYGTGGEAPYAGRTPPISVLAVPVDNPPPRSRAIAPAVISGIFAAIQTYQSAFAFAGGNAPYVGRPPSPAIFAATAVDQPPRSRASNHAIIAGLLAADQSSKAAYYFFGGNAPYVGRQVHPSIAAVPADPPPHVTIQIPCGNDWRTVMPSEVFAGRRPNPSLLSIQVDNPPFTMLPAWWTSVNAAWATPVPPVQLGRRPNAALFPQTDNPPINASLPAWWTSVYAAWASPVPPVQLGQRPNAALFQAPQVDNPPISSSLPSWWTSVTASWATADPYAQHERRPNAALFEGAVAQVDNPPIAMSLPLWWTSVAASWATADSHFQHERRPNAAFLDGLVVDNPPIARAMPAWWTSVISGWKPPVAPILRRVFIPPAPIITLISGETASTYVLAAGDVGTRVFVEVVATNAAGSSAPAQSATTTLIVP